MEEKRRKVGWFESLVGAAVALTILTGYRSDLGIGYGEVALLVAILLGGIKGLANGWRGSDKEVARMPIILLVYTGMVLLPVTVISNLSEVSGASIRDLIAYFLSFCLLYTLYVARADMQVVAVAFVLVLSCVLIYQLVADGATAWYANRFTGGAKNPNQLALHCVAAMLMTVLAVRGQLVRWLVLGVFVYFGFQARSDAFMACLIGMLPLMAISLAVPKRLMVPTGVPLVLACLALLVVFQDELVLHAGAEWVSADEGGGRVVLYENGMRAWLDSVSTVLVGNGAGSFSGLYGPYQLSEAHNTPIDLLALGGLVGLAVMGFYPIKTVLLAYSKGEVLLFSMLVGLLMFSLFHFVARQPVWWLSIYAAFWSLRNPAHAHGSMR